MEPVILPGGEYQSRQALKEAAARPLLALSQEARRLQAQLSKAEHHVNVGVRATGVAQAQASLARLQTAEDALSLFVQSGNEVTPEFADYATAVGNTGRLLVSGWAVRLIEHGRQLDEAADSLLEEATELPFGLDTGTTDRLGWRELSRPIRGVLRKHSGMRHSVRRLEVDVEHYMHNAAVVELQDDVLPVVETLQALERTYQRSFDLCVLKLNTLNTGLVSATNLQLARGALYVAVLSLMVAAGGLYEGCTSRASGSPGPRMQAEIRTPAPVNPLPGRDSANGARGN